MLRTQERQLEYFTKNIAQTFDCIEGDNVELSCAVCEDNIPAQWTKDGVVIEPSAKYTIKDMGKSHMLCIVQLDLQDVGNYSVAVNNRTRSSSIQVKEYFTKPLVSMTCMEGETVQFECEVLDDNQRAMWFKDGTKLSASDKYKLERYGQLHRLVITNAQCDDKGEYSVSIKCCVRRTELRVQEYFTKPLGTMTCIEGENVQFECEVIDDNQTALWFKDGTEVNTSDRYNVERHGKLHRLVVIEAKLDDKGEYSVRIKNCVRWTTLQVQEYFTQNMNTTIECLEGDNVELKCDVLFDDIPAEWKKDSVIVNNCPKYKIKTIGKSHTLSVIQVELQDAGNYSVNVNGRVRSTSLHVREIPAAINQLSEADKDLYLHIIKSGTETRYYIRIVIIGENGVGKTCLLRRLMGEPIEGVESTDGVEIVHKCKIRLSDGSWINEKVTDERTALITRIRRAVNTGTSDLYSQSAKPLLVQDVHFQDNISSQSGKPKNSENARLQEQLNSKSDEPKAKQNKEAIVQLEFEENSELFRHESNDDAELGALSPLVGEIKKSDAFNKSNNLQSDQLKIVYDELSKFLNDIEKYDVPKEVLVDCGFWDFAGQSEYYKTHPIFLNPNALHLLVADITKDIKQISTEQGYDRIGEYIDFWFDSIHSCGAVEETMDDTGDYLNPPVIVVCTGIDKCKHELDERKEVFRKQLLPEIEPEAKYKHLRQICYVSNTEPADADFYELRRAIFEFGKTIKTFGEKLPLRWIRLEHALHILRDAGVNILSLHDITALASIYSVEDKREVNLFLNYQHNVGSIIYFESLKEYIVLNQKWLADAFRCLVTLKVDPGIKVTHGWRKLETTGQLNYDLIEHLFKKEPKFEFNKHKDHILKLMELFGIIVKLNDGKKQNSPTYYMPCMISKKTSVKEIKEVFRVKNDICTPWLCIQFDFMPLDFFNHILCYYITQYPLCTEPSTKRLAIYHGMGIFYLDNNKSSKFILCFSKNTIGIQLWQWGKIEQNKYKTILEELESVIHRVKGKYEPRNVSYIVKIKCPDGDIHEQDGRCSYEDLVLLRDKEYFCEEHLENHNTKDIFQTWLKDYSEKKDYVPEQKKIQGQEGIQDARFKQKCHVCDKEPSVYWCHGCQRSMCQDCNNQHMESDDTEYHIVQHLQDMYSLDYNFNVNAKWIWDIKVLHDDVLVIADHSGKQLVTCDITGQQQHTIPLPGQPWCIAVVDNNTVAVTLLYTTTVVIVDVRQRQVIQRTDVKVGCDGIMHRDNQLFVGCGHDRTINVMNMSGKVTRTIPVGVWPMYICGGEAGRIYYTDNDKLYCIDTVGNTLFTFTDPNMSGPREITTDDEGHVLVICHRSNNVLRISPDGKQSQVIITQIPPLSDWWPYICYNSLSKSVVIGRHDNVYVYKKV